MEQLKHDIEEMSKYHHVEILKILHTDPTIVLNENANGTFVNLNEVKPEIIEKVQQYIQYIQLQKKDIDDTENIKKQLQNNFLSNGSI